MPQGACGISSYSPFERTVWRRLAQRYSTVCTEAEVDALFGSPRTVDRYLDLMRSKTEWPTRDRSIKTLARYLELQWRDASPSGTASIEWFVRWVRTRDASLKQRILGYNEDECSAMSVLLDGIRLL